jgi:hypothetical protein
MNNTGTMKDPDVRVFYPLTAHPSTNTLLTKNGDRSPSTVARGESDDRIGVGNGEKSEDETSMSSKGGERSNFLKKFR